MSETREKCPNCGDEIEDEDIHIRKKDKFREETDQGVKTYKTETLMINCQNCNIFKQKYAKCPNCEKITFSIHPMNSQADVSKGECVECGYSQTGGFSVFGG